MSGVFKAIDKVFSKVWDFIRPVVEVVAIAAAVYFTAGVALSAFPSTAAFAAALPGFASTGGVAGEGVFSSLADSIGMGGGLASGAATDAVAASGAASAGAATAFGADIPTAAAADAGAAGGAAAGGAGGGLAATPLAAAGDVAGTAGTGVGASAATAAAGSTATGLASTAFTNKLLLASVGANLIGGLTAPSPTDIAAAKAGFYGSYYGMDSNGSSAPAPNLQVGPQQEPSNTATAGNTMPMPGVNVPATTPTVQAAPGFTGVQTPKLIPVNPAGAIAPPNQPSAVAGTTPLATPKLIPGASQTSNT